MGLGSTVFLGIPTLSTARRSLAWIDSLASLQMPLGTSMAKAYVEDLPVDVARNRLCQMAIDCGAEYLVFISDDVIAPPNMILEMLSKIGREFPVENGKVARASMVTGVYWTKTVPTEPYLWNGLLQGSYRDWQVGEFFPVDFAGCDALMIETAMLKELPQPWFSLDWIWEPGQEVSPIATEDFYFYTKARDHGFRLFADTAIQCRHEDRGTGQQFGLTVDMPQAASPAETGPDFEGLLVADLGAGVDSPPFTRAEKVVRFDGAADVRPDVRCDLLHIPSVYNGTFDVVHSRHVLEHFPRAQAPEAIAAWTKLLKPKGQLVIRVPNVGWALAVLHSEQSSTDQKSYAWQQLYGAQRNEYDRHYNGFTARKLENLLRFAEGVSEVEVTLEDDGQNLCGIAYYEGPTEKEALTTVWARINAREGSIRPSDSVPGSGGSSSGAGVEVATPAPSQGAAHG